MYSNLQITKFYLKTRDYKNPNVHILTTYIYKSPHVRVYNVNLKMF